MQPNTLQLRIPQRLVRASWQLNVALRKLAATGQGLVEYAILLMFIAIVAVGAVTLFGNKTSATYSKINTKVTCAADNTQAMCTNGN